MNENEILVFQKTVVLNQNDRIFIQFLCDFFGINSDNQSRFIKSDLILQTESSKMTDEITFNDKRQRLCLTKKGFLRWIQLINPNYVKIELREKFIQYQRLVFDYLYGNNLIPNIKRQHEIDIRIKELNKSIHLNMVEHKQLTLERKLLSQNNYSQLGLVFDDDMAALNPKSVKKINY